MSAPALSILIPTLNRPDFVLRTLRYYAAIGFDGKLLVGDSSGPEHRSRIKAFLRDSGSALDVTYLECPELNDRATVLRLTGMIATPYATLHGDDDVIFPAGAAECITLLESDPGLVSVHGRAWLFSVEASGAHGRMAWGSAYPLPTCAADTPLARLEALLSEYTVTLFTVHRAAVWQAMWRDVDGIADRTFGAEVLPCCRSAVLGKSAALDVPYLLRQVHPARYHLPGQASWRQAEGWDADFTTICTALADDVRLASGGTQTPGAGDIKAIFERTYLAEHAATPVQGNAGAGLRHRLARAIGRHPAADAGARRVLAAARLARVRSAMPQSSGIRREVDLFVDAVSQSPGG